MFEIKQIDRALKELSHIQSWCEYYMRRSKEKIEMDMEDRFNHGYFQAAKGITEIVNCVVDDLKREKERKIADTIQHRSVVAIALSITAIICCIILKARM